MNYSHEEMVAILKFLRDLDELEEDTKFDLGPLSVLKLGDYLFRIIDINPNYILEYPIDISGGVKDGH